MGVSTPACPPLLWAGPGAVSQPRQQWARPALPALEPSNSQWMVLEGPFCYHILRIRPAGPGLRDLHVNHLQRKHWPSPYLLHPAGSCRFPIGKDNQHSQGRISLSRQECGPWHKQ